MGMFSTKSTVAGNYDNWLDPSNMGGQPVPVGYEGPRPGGEDPFTLQGTERDKYDPMADEYKARESPQMSGASINTAPQDQFRGQQQSLYNQMAARASGQAPSAAELQMQGGIDANMRALRAAQASQRGGNVGAIQQGMTGQMQAGNLQGVQNLAQLRAQEQAAAEGRLAQALQGARGQDIGLATSQAGFDQQTGQANLGAQLQTQAQNDAMVQYFMSLGMSADQANQQANIQRMQMANELNMAMAQSASQQEAAAMGAAGDVISTAGSAAGAAAVSDKRAKKNIRKADGELGDMLDNLAAYGWEYRDKAHGGKDHVGVMAQDLEKSKLGRAMVIDDGSGTKKVDLERMVTAALAAAVSTHKRLKKVEGGDVGRNR